MVGQSRIGSIIGTAAIGLVLAGCASSGGKVHVDKDASADLSRCRTFKWQPAENKGPSSLSEQRIREAAMQTLQAKGYTQAENADCRVSYVFSARELPKAGPSTGVGVGGGTGGIGGGIGISIPIGHKTKYAGTFTIDVIDPSRNAQIWTGSLDRNIAGRDVSDDEARDAVKTILGKFPDKGK